MCVIQRHIFNVLYVEGALADVEDHLGYAHVIVGIAGIVGIVGIVGAF